MEWSSYQTAVFDWLASSQANDNLVVEAVAGSGKSTTIEEGHKYIPKGASILDCTFNKHIAVAMAQRLPDAFVKTYHALGLQSVTGAYGRLNVNGYRNDDILKRHLGKDRRFMFAPIKKLVSLFKANLDPFSPSKVDEYIRYYGIDTEDVEGDLYHKMIHEVGYLLEPDNLLETGDIDFDDECWLPVIQELPCQKFDFIFVDEFQDTNRVQYELVMRHKNGHSRVIGVGDRYQSIYAWRGADADAIPNLIQQLNADVLPLSITYRNPVKVVELVKSKYPHIGIVPRDNAPEGVIETISEYKFLNIVAPGDGVLCRINAPLIKPAMDMLSSGKKAVVRGKDIGRSLQTLVKKIIRKTKPITFREFLSGMNEYCNNEITRLHTVEKHTQANILQDSKDVLVALTEYCDTTDKLLRHLEMLFSDEVEGTTFSSVHRAKGLQWKNVYILRPDLIPYPKATQEWQIQQEANLEYVAYTRSEYGLYFVGGTA